MTAVITMSAAEQGSLSSRIYGKVRQGLIEGIFLPGERLKFRDLAEQLGASVTPVREACLRLVSEQALELRSGRFVLVPELTRDRYWQIRTIRTALECLATELAAKNATEADVLRLTELHENFVAYEAARDIANARSFNRAFHFGVYELCGMPMLVAQIENLWASMGPILNVYYQKIASDYVGAEEHVSILHALRTHNGPMARASMDADIVRGGMNLMRYFDELEGKVRFDSSAAE